MESRERGLIQDIHHSVSKLMGKIFNQAEAWLPCVEVQVAPANFVPAL